MSVVAAAVVGSAIIGGVASNQAAKKQADATKKGLSQSGALQQSAIQQAKDYFSLGQKSAQAGYKSALDLFKANQAAKYQPMIQGNVAAQRVIGQGAIQANNAILGLPIDMSYANNPTALQPDLSGMQSAALPPQSQPLQQVGPEQAAGLSSAKSSGGSGGLLLSPTEMLNPKTALTNPLGLGDKLNPAKQTKKLLKKIF